MRISFYLFNPRHNSRPPILLWLDRKTINLQERYMSLLPLLPNSNGYLYPKYLYKVSSNFADIAYSPKRWLNLCKY